MNPFELAHVEIASPLPAERALDALEALVRDGIEAYGRRYRLFGERRGRFVTMSLGMPLLGGGSPVLRAWLHDGSGPTRFGVSVGARIEFIVFASFWLLVTVVGGATQLFLQLRALAAGRGTIGDVVEVLPGIGIMAGILLLGTWLFRRRAGGQAEMLVHAFRDAIDAWDDEPVGAARATDAVSAEPIE